MFLRSKVFLMLTGVSLSLSVAAETTTIEEMANQKAAVTTASAAPITTNVTAPPVILEVPDIPSYLVSVYGLDDELTAELMSGERLIIVRKGTLLPSGETVTGVSRGYIEVQKIAKKKTDKKTKKGRHAVTRIWLQGSLQPEVARSTSPLSQPPMMAPMLNPPRVPGFPR